MKKEQPSSPPLVPLGVGYQRELLVNDEKFLVGRAVGRSNGVKEVRDLRLKGAGQRPIEFQKQKLCFILTRGKRCGRFTFNEDEKDE
jgi:hypothetical protein